MSPRPQPPYLVVREGRAFWVEARGETSATRQALEEGCYRESWCYDADGRVWPIVTATFKRPRSLAERLFPWRRLPVQLEFGTPESVDLPEIVSRLAAVLRSDNEFCDDLSSPPRDILRRFEQARTPDDLIGVARDYNEAAA